MFLRIRWRTIGELGNRVLISRQSIQNYRSCQTTLMHTYSDIKYNWMVIKWLFRRGNRVFCSVWSLTSSIIPTLLAWNYEGRLYRDLGMISGSKCNIEAGTFGTLHCQLLPMLSYLHYCLDHINLVSCLLLKKISKNAQLSAC